jgi:Gpi18-like mannosyltransferase
MLWAIALLLSSMLMMIIFFLKKSNGDLDLYILPWFQTIVSDGRLASLNAGFSDYTPPYIYFLVLCSVIDGMVDRVVIVKVGSMLWTLFGAAQVYGICRIAGRTKQFSVLAAIIFYTLPEVSLNNIVWGQSDVIYTSFILAFVRYTLLERRILALVMFGIALSLKPQPIFIGPVMGYLLVSWLSRGDRFLNALCYALALPVTYLVMMVPAILEGRSWQSLLSVYGNGRHLLSVGAPNLYFILQQFVSYPEEPSAHATLLHIAPNLFHAIEPFLLDRTVVAQVGFALSFTVCGILLVMFVMQRRRPSLSQFLTMMTLVALLVPYVTPMMHERYFFLAGVLSFLLALVRPGMWPAAVSMQLAAMCTYQGQLFGEYLHPMVPKYLMISAVVFVTISVVVLVRAYFGDWRMVRYESGAWRAVESATITEPPARR